MADDMFRNFGMEPMRGKRFDLLGFGRDPF